MVASADIRRHKSEGTIGPDRRLDNSLLAHPNMPALQATLNCYKHLTCILTWVDLSASSQGNPSFQWVY